MKAVSANAKLSGFAQKLPELANELAIVYDMASNLSIVCDRYHDPHDQYGGPPTLSQLQNTAGILYSAYMNMAALTGLDPCEQFEETQARLEIFRNRRARVKFPPNFFES